MKKATLRIEGMSCAGCVDSVRKVLGRTAGIAVLDVHVGEATVSFDEARVTETVLRSAVDDAGFTVLDVHYG